MTCLPLHRKIALISLLFLSAFGGVRAQDLEQVTSSVSERLRSGEILRVSGQANANAGLNYFSSTQGAERRRAPYTWGATAGINFDVLGIQAPFSMAVSSRDTRYNLPSYAFVGLSPSYRWATAHLGDRTLRFSPYSLSDVNFRGAGVELTPGKWYVGAMYGKLRSERLEDAGAIQSGLTTETYRRTGQGLKVGFAPGESSEFSVSYFGSADKAKGTGEVPLAADTSGVSPERNAVLTFSANQRLSDLVSVEAEVARSVLTRDDRALPLPDAGAGLSLLGLIGTPTTTTAGANALSAAVNFTPAFAQFQFKYERVDPEYRTHGSLFFLNDFENLTAGVTAPILKGRLNVGVNGGLQRNDLRDDQAAALRRVIGAVNLSFAWSETVTSSLGASNFSTTNRYRTFDPRRPGVDSIVLAQTQLSLNASHAVIVDPAGTQSVVVSGSYQRANLIRDSEVDAAQGTNFILGTVNYSLRPDGSPHSWTAGLLANRNAVAESITTLAFGPSVGYGLSFAEEAGTFGAQATYNLTRVSQAGVPNVPASTTTGSLTSVSLNSGYRITESQRLNLSASFVLAGGGSDTQATRPGYSDVQVQLGYGFTFQPKAR